MDFNLGTRSCGRSSPLPTIWDRPSCCAFVSDGFVFALLPGWARGVVGKGWHCVCAERKKVKGERSRPFGLLPTLPT